MSHPAKVAVVNDVIAPAMFPGTEASPTPQSGYETTRRVSNTRAKRRLASLLWLRRSRTLTVKPRSKPGTNNCATGWVPPFDRGDFVEFEVNRPSTTRDMTTPLHNTHVGLSERIGAGEGIRTLDPNLGKVVLYP
jgi:hypothetical protein